MARCARRYHAALCFFFFNDPAPTEIYPLSLHDALPIYSPNGLLVSQPRQQTMEGHFKYASRSEEHTSELQSPMYLVRRLLLEKKRVTRREPRSRGESYGCSPQRGLRGSPAPPPPPSRGRSPPLSRSSRGILSLIIF